MDYLCKYGKKHYCRLNNEKGECDINRTFNQGHIAPLTPEGLFSLGERVTPNTICWEHEQIIYLCFPEDYEPSFYEGRISEEKQRIKRVVKTALESSTDHICVMVGN